MRRLGSLLFFVTLLFLASSARAQIHWDASAQAGVMKRILSDRPAGGKDAGFGPIGEIHGHVALLPLLRVGAYVSHDIMPIPGDASALQITSVGARVKVTSPVPLEPWHVYAFAGLGYAGVYGPSFHHTVLISGTPADALATGAGGGFWEIPAGIGASYKVWGMWHVTAELAARFGFGFAGSVYSEDGRAAFANGAPPLLVDTAGTNPTGFGLMIGVMADK